MATGRRTVEASGGWWSLLGRCFAFVAVLGQLLVTAAGAGAPLAFGETLVVCTAQGYRTVAPAGDGSEGGHAQYRCDLCCLGSAATAPLPDAIAISWPTRAAIAADRLVPAAPPTSAPRFSRPQGRAPPTHLV